MPRPPPIGLTCGIPEVLALVPAVSHNDLARFFASVGTKARVGWHVSVMPQCASHRGTRFDWCCGCLGDVAKAGRKLLQTQTCADEAEDAASNDPHAEAPGAVAPGAPGNN